MYKKVILVLIALVCIGYTDIAANLKKNDILDISSLLFMARDPQHHLFKYFNALSDDASGEEVAAIINNKIFIDPHFQYEAIQAQIPPNTKVYNQMTQEEKEWLSITNWDLLHELYPDIIRKRQGNQLKNRIGAKIPIKQIEGKSRLKADIISFINQIVANKKVALDSSFMKRYFQANRSNDVHKLHKELGEFESVRGTIKIPVNGIRLVEKENVANCFQVKIVNGRKSKNENTFEVSFKNDNQWEIVNFKEFSSAILHSGYAK